MIKIQIPPRVGINLKIDSVHKLCLMNNSKEDCFFTFKINYLKFKHLNYKKDYEKKKKEREKNIKHITSGYPGN